MLRCPRSYETTSLEAELVLAKQCLTGDKIWQLLWLQMLNYRHQQSWAELGRASIIAKQGLKLCLLECCLLEG